MPEGRTRGDARRTPDLAPEALGGGREAAGGDARAAGEPGHGRGGVDLAGGAEARGRAPRLGYAVDHGVVQGLAAALGLDDEGVGRRVAGAEVDPDAGSLRRRRRGLVLGLGLVVDEGVPVHPRRLAAPGGRRGGLAAGTPAARDGVPDGGERGRGRHRLLVADLRAGEAGVLVVDRLGRGARRGLGGLDLRLRAVRDGVGHEHERVVGDRLPGVGPRRPVVPVLDGEPVPREAVVRQAVPRLEQLRLDPALRQLHLGRQLVARPQPGVLVGAPRVLLVQQLVEALVVLARVFRLEGAEAHVGVDFGLVLVLVLVIVVVVVVIFAADGGARLRGDGDGSVAYEAAGRLRAGRQRRAPPRPLPAARRHDVLETPARARDPLRILRVEGVQVLLLRLALEKAREEVPRYDLGECVRVAVFADDLPRPLDSLRGWRRRHELEVVPLADEGCGGLCVGLHGRREEWSEQVNILSCRC